MKQIPLTRGKHALVDDGDFESLSKFDWYALSGRRGKFYAARHFPGNHSLVILMHRQLLAALPDEEVDHEDGDSLNNRRKNLRLATRVQQCANATRRTDNSSGAKGVNRRPNGRFQVQIGSGKTRKCLGTFDTFQQASEVYNIAARQRWGHFSKTNQ